MHEQKQLTESDKDNKLNINILTNRQTPLANSPGDIITALSYTN